MNTNTLRLPLPVTLGIRFGRSIAHDTLASGLAMEWLGLTPECKAKAKAEGMEPGTGEWETMIRHAKEAFWVALYDLGACEPSEEDSLRSE
jgi:hypothetical protein